MLLKSNTVLALGCLLALLVAMGASAQGSATRPIPTLENGILFGHLKSGQLIGVFQQVGASGPEIMARYSSDNGATWEQPRVLFTLPKSYARWGTQELLVDANDEFHLFFMIDGTNGKAFAFGEEDRPLIGETAGMRIDIGYMRTSNHRTTWSKPRVLWIGYTGALNSVIQMENGRILLPFSYLTKRTWSNRGDGLAAFTFMGQYNCTELYSEDSGATWHVGDNLMTPVPDIVSAYGCRGVGRRPAQRPTRLDADPDATGTLLAVVLRRWRTLVRTDANRYHLLRLPAGLVRLSDGRIVLLWNDSLRYPYAYGGRQILHAAISSDDGKKLARLSRSRARSLAERAPARGWGLRYRLPVSGGGQPRPGDLRLRSGTGTTTARDPRPVHGSTRRPRPRTSRRKRKSGPPGTRGRGDRRCFGSAERQSPPDLEDRGGMAGSRRMELPPRVRPASFACVSRSTRGSRAR